MHTWVGGASNFARDNQVKRKSETTGNLRGNYNTSSGQAQHNGILLVLVMAQLGGKLVSGVDAVLETRPVTKYDDS
jgi:hypothetical protein